MAEDEDLEAPAQGVESYWVQKRAAKRRADHEAYVRGRWWTIAVLFALCVGASIGLPAYHAWEATRSRGSFWEVHLQSLGVFFLTKTAELVIYATDPTLEFGGTSVHKDFLFAFLPNFIFSFSGYLNGYADANGVVIAQACPGPLAQALAKLMMADYVVGVVIIQWCVLPLYAARDPSHACFLKLLHMGLLASKTTLPPEQKHVWNKIALARTFAEDLPQAVLQTVYLIYVKKNVFMLSSVAIAIASSLKALYDALARALATAAAKEAFEKAEREMYSCSWDGTIRCWNAETGDCKKIMDAGSPANTIGATRGAIYNAHDGGWCIREWSVRTGEVTRQFQHPGRNGFVAVTGDKMFSWTQGTPTIKEWDLGTGEFARDLFEVKVPAIRDMKVVCDKLYTHSPGASGSVAEFSLGDPVRGAPLRTFCHGSDVDAIVATRRRLLAGSYFGRTVKEWSLETGERTRTLEGYTGCALYAAGGLVYGGSASERGTINAWSLDSGQVVQRLRGHSSTVRGLTMLTGKLYSCSDDRTIKMWAAKTGVCLRTVEGHTGTVIQLVIH